eukprot:TRINITY_DN24021_c0_g1_i1.p1 TRINITY_DN24021_c0_g1~~TRINITY_DN24021_c0_g1_i1.p1  ORF type:complete len:304 (-),score=60.78 TRINITY_DN24021_c0_g1_i1:91-879(-)
MDPQERDQNGSGYRWAWMTEAQKNDKFVRLAILKAALDPLLSEVSGPVYIHGSSLWGRALESANDIDLIAPETEDPPRGLEVCVAGKRLQVNIGTTLYEVNKVGASLLKRRGAEECIDYSSHDNGVDEEDEEDEDDQEGWLSGMRKALGLLSGDQKVRSSDGSTAEYKEQKLRLEAMIYIAQRLVDYKELLDEGEHEGLIQRITAEEDELFDGTLYHAITRLHLLSLEGAVDTSLYTRGKIDTMLHEKLETLYREIMTALVT